MIQPNEDAEIFAEGVLEVLPDGHGFLRSSDSNYLPAPDDIYVAPFHINEFHLKTSDTVACRVRPPRANETHFILVEIEAVNFKLVAPRP